MVDDTAIELVRSTLIMTLKIAMPLLLTAVVIGLVISLIQSVTSIQDQTLTFVPKLGGIVLAAILLMPWITIVLVEFATEMFQLF
ncbi:MAG: flagellar biosynthetic protein FliQ [Phycisphaerales bacterium]|jgi:flagellar biosynthetic protein FliQ